MITISAADALLGLTLLVLFEVSLFLRLRPLKVQLATIEHLLRNDLGQVLMTVADHEERLVELEQKLEDHLGGK